MNSEQLKEYLYRRLPTVYRSMDEEVNQDLALQRMIGVFVDGAFKTVLDDIDTLWNFIDIDKIPDDYLNYFGSNFGFTNDFGLDADLYRKFLKVIVPIYNMKGSKYLIEYLGRELSELDVSVELIEQTNARFRTWYTSVTSETNDILYTLVGGSQRLANGISEYNVYFNVPYGEDLPDTSIPIDTLIDILEFFRPVINIFHYNFVYHYVDILTLVATESGILDIMYEKLTSEIVNLTIQEVRHDIVYAQEGTDTLTLAVQSNGLTVSPGCLTNTITFKTNTYHAKDVLSNGEVHFY